MPDVENNLGRLRQKRGLTAAGLAKTIGVSRQAIYAMEAGSYVPNTVTALRLARALEASVEDLFTLTGNIHAPELRSEQVVFLRGYGDPRPGQLVQLCQVNRRLVASAPAPVPWYVPAPDAVVVNKSATEGKIKVRVFDAEGEFRNRILVAGCDPGVSILARHVQSAGVEMVLAHRNSSQALMLLKEGCVHIAGTHLRDDASGESNVSEIRRMFPRNSVAVISYAVWEEGILIAPGNPKSIHGIEDFIRKDISIVNREPGSGSRLLLDSHLKRLRMRTRSIRGFDRVVLGHLPGAWQVYSGAADCCLATRAAARVFGLGFIPLVRASYDLAIRRQHLDWPTVQTLLDTLTRSSFRRELETLGGYDTKAAGQRML